MTENIKETIDGTLSTEWYDEDAEYSPYDKIKFKYGIFSKVVVLVVNFINGISSNYPLCCIWNYNRILMQGHLPAAYMNDKFPDLIYRTKDWSHGEPEYVQCERCLRKKYHIKPENERNWPLLSDNWAINEEPYGYIIKVNNNEVKNEK